ncbi:MAG TPA: hypothetical protein PLM89_02920 [Anaerolineales bacterium]|nr:hypothetical protein [Anaerolineales bacterium]
MTKILNQLKAYLQSKSGDHLPYSEMLKRFIKRVDSQKIDERDLLMKALSALEQVESKQLYRGLEIATRNRKELNRHFEGAINQAIAERDALSLVKLQRLQKLLDSPPDSTRTLDQETVDLALDVWDIKEKHPNWSLKDIAVKHFGDISYHELIKKATQRVRKAQRKSKSVP